ncbi:MAG TPA: 2OG-Fe(II) oxygenase [Phenylobacterium sp.]
MSLKIGAPAPVFRARTPGNPDFEFATLGGRFVLLAFLPSDMGERRAAMNLVGAEQARFDEVRAVAFMVVRDAPTAAAAKDIRGLRWFFDLDGTVSRLYGALDDAGRERPMWVLLDPTLRVLQTAPIAEPGEIFQNLRNLPDPALHAGAPMAAPVLTVPRIFEPELCRELIALHQETGGRPTGVMRDIDGRSHHVMDELKRRRDVLVTDEAQAGAIKRRLSERLLPELRKAFQYEVTRIERYLVSCYDAADGGVFHAHRDDVTLATAHRRFACSINLNDDFEGGDLIFPEYGAQTYRPPLGGAVVFSCRLLHEVTPMRTGRRYAFLPFFYDEAAAKVREDNRAHMGESV